MKQLTEPDTKKVPNAWGHDNLVTLTDYEVEPDDVGCKREHFGGHNHASYIFAQSDVGRTIRVDSQPGGCWYFYTKV